MDNYEARGVTALTLYLILSVAIILAAYLAGIFRKEKDVLTRILTHWKTALIITAVYLISSVIGSGFSAISLLWSIGLFIQALVGLSIACRMDGYQPLPITTSVRFGWKYVRSCLLMVGIAALAGVVIMLTSFIGMGVGRLFGEAASQSGVANLLPQNGASAFFALLAGAGILEGVTYRLVVLSFALKLFKSKALAVVISALVFALYHFTPLNLMNQVYWKIPVTQFVNVLLGAAVIGFIYVKRGFETSVLAHTVADWLPLMVFLYFM